MQTVKAFRGNARTFLTHMFGRGLDDDRYVIERFRSKADGEIHPRRRNGASKKSRGKTSREIVSLSTVQKDDGPSATRSSSAPASPSPVEFNIGATMLSGVICCGDADSFGQRQTAPPFSKEGVRIAATYSGALSRSSGTPSSPCPPSSGVPDQVPRHRTAPSPRPSS